MNTVVEEPYTVESENSSSEILDSAALLISEMYNLENKPLNGNKEEIAVRILKDNLKLISQLKTMHPSTHEDVTDQIESLLSSEENVLILLDLVGCEGDSHRKMGRRIYRYRA